MEIAITNDGPDEREESMRLIRESAESVLREDISRSRALRFTSTDYDPEKLAEFAELGWIMIRVPEADDGLGMGLSELVTLARELGRGLTPEPLLNQAVIAPYLPTELREAVVSGEKIVLPAFTPFGATPAQALDGQIFGTTEPAPMGRQADAFFVQTDTGAMLIDKEAAGLTSTQHGMHDGSQFTHLKLDGVKGQSITCDCDTLREEATLVLSAYFLGLSDAAFDLTNEYLKDRSQFGKPIGAFQSLQHEMVDLFLEKSLLAAAVDSAAEQWDKGNDATEARRLISLAKARANKASNAITRSAIQLHGGIGYTDEADIGLFLRKTMTLCGLLGTERFHRTRAYRLGETGQ